MYVSLLSAICHQSTRVQHIKHECKKRGYTGDLSRSMLKIVANNLLVSDRFKILICVNWKTGSSTLKSVLLNNSAFGNWREADHFSADLKPLSSFPMSGLLYRIRNYFNVIMVRHPLDRLVSAYNDKLNMDIVYRNRLAPKIIDKYHINVTEEDYDQGKGVSFKMLLQYIKDGGNDPHWAVYNGMCRPCHVAYHYVMRTETFAPDLGYLIDHKLAGKGHKVKKNNHRSTDMHIHRKLKEYDDIEDSVFRAISKHYDIDMRLFGYHYKRVNGSLWGSCGIKGSNCC